MKISMSEIRRFSARLSNCNKIMEWEINMKKHEIYGRNVVPQVPDILVSLAPNVVITIL